MTKDYSRFHVWNERGEFDMIDQKTGWVWKGISSYPAVLKMMQYILNHNLEFKDDEYKRIRKLEGHEWEREFGEE